MFVFVCISAKGKKKRKTTEYAILSRREKSNRQHLELLSSNRDRKLTMSQQQSQPHNNTNNTSIAGKQRVSLNLISLALLDFLFSIVCLFIMAFEHRK